MKRQIAIFCFALLATTIARGQILIPVAFNTVSGANGSQWTTEHYAHNNGSETVWISVITGCRLSAVHACDEPVGGGVTRSLPNYYYDRPFAVWLVKEGAPETVSISSFVRNRSDGRDGWATAIPNPRLSDFFAEQFHIAPVPADRGSRVSLRLYSLPWEAEISSLDVEFWIYAGAGGASPTHLVETRTISIVSYSNGEGQLVPMGYAEVHDVFAGLADRTDSTLVSVLVKAPDPHARIWGFASVTNNETQHITVFAP